MAVCYRKAVGILLDAWMSVSLVREPGFQRARLSGLVEKKFSLHFMFLAHFLEDIRDLNQKNS